MTASSFFTGGWLEDPVESPTYVSVDAALRAAAIQQEQLAAVLRADDAVVVSIAAGSAWVASLSED